MLAAVFESKGVLRIKDVEKPKPAFGEVLVRVKVCGVCATDVHTLKGESISGQDPFPLIPGHEFSGVVEETGDGVTRLKCGDKVVIDPIYPCGQCSYCMNNQQNHCENLQGPGTTVPGGFAEYVSVPAYAAHRFERLSFDEAALTEPLATVIYGQERARIGYGDNVLVIGAGAIGLLHMQLARVSGAAKVVAVDLEESRLARAMAVGVDRVVAKAIRPNSSDEIKQGVPLRISDEILDVCPQGYDVIIEATGVPAVVEGGLRYLKRKGRFVIFGVSPHHSSVQINPYDVYRHDWEIIGAFALNKTAAPALALLEEGKINVRPVIGRQYRLEELSTALDILARGKAEGKLQVLFP